MQTIICVFLFSLVLSLILTPLARKTGTMIGAVDYPGTRKVHERPVPRFGGPAVSVAVLLPLALASLFGSNITDQLLQPDMKLIFLALGGIALLAIGLVDDVYNLWPKSKLVLQIAGCSLPYLAGLSIQDLFHVPLGSIGHVITYPLTIFWLLLFVNAVNLIDGLDGLAGGMVFFAAIAMTVLSLFQQNLIMAMIFSALAGSVLGFLRYNFNPASIFLGDGGSYFLGYCLGAFSVYGSMKNQLGSIMLIMLFMLGIPLIDTLIAPVRRFLRGRHVFRPDRDHIHHRLLNKGLTKQTVVLSLYGATALLCISSIGLVFIRNELSALVLIFFAVSAVIFFKKMGCADSLLANRGGGRMSDEFSAVVDVQGDLEATITLSECWQATGKALDMIGAAYAELHLLSGPTTAACTRIPDAGERTGAKNMLTWSKSGLSRECVTCRRTCLKLEIPLVADSEKLIGMLWVVINFEEQNMSSFAMTRVDCLKISLARQLERLDGSSVAGS